MRISIVTLTLDTPVFFDETIASLNGAGPFELEHIVVHDGDDAYIRDLEQRCPEIKFLKGEGGGATLAAAHAVEAASGDFILFLHSDDRLGPDALARLAACAAARPEVKIWTGYARIFQTVPDGTEQTMRWLVDREATRLSLGNICDDIPLLSARFCCHSVFASVGNFDPAFSESSDREFLLRALIAGTPEAPLDVLVSELRYHEGSRTIHSRPGWVPPYFAEHIAMADDWLGRPGIGSDARRFLRNWRAREILRLGVYECRAGDWKRGLGGMFSAALTDPLWIFRLGTVFMAHRRRLRNDHPALTHPEVPAVGARTK